MSQPTAEDVVAAAVTLAPQIRAPRDEIEATRQLPQPLVQALTAAGLFQLHLPRSMGDWELPQLTAFHAIEALSKADGAVGWCAMIATGVTRRLHPADRSVAARDGGRPPGAPLSASDRANARASVSGHPALWGTGHPTFRLSSTESVRISVVGDVGCPGTRDRRVDKGNSILRRGGRLPAEQSQREGVCYAPT